MTSVPGPFTVLIDQLCTSALCMLGRIRHIPNGIRFFASLSKEGQCLYTILEVLQMHACTLRLGAVFVLCPCHQQMLPPATPA